MRTVPSRRGVLALLLGPLLAASCAKQDQSSELSWPIVASAAGPVTSGGDLNPRLLRRFAPLPTILGKAAAPAPMLVSLGRVLYYERRLSATGQVSCNDCHPLSKYGATREPASAGVHGAEGLSNPPSTYNVAGTFAQFWDGRASSVDQQPEESVVNSEQRGMVNGEQVVASLRAIPGYRALFEQAFPGVANPISYENVGRAIGAFERGLVTPCRWDRYLWGDIKALTPTEKAGARLFGTLGCMLCHTGALVSGSMSGRAGGAGGSVAGAAANRRMFKVPSLRNVARTAPYFHDGSAATLRQAVKVMAFRQAGVDLTEPETDALEAWLGSLTGEIPQAYIARPELPADAPALTAHDGTDR